MGKPVLLMSMAVVVFGVALVPVAEAASCSVPSGLYPTIQSAIADPSCTEIAVAAGTYEESPVIARSLTLSGVGGDQTLIQGRTQIQAGTVVLEDLGIQTGTGLFIDALLVSSGAQVTGSGLVVVNGGAEVQFLFGDGFESGDTSGWSGTNP